VQHNSTCFPRPRQTLPRRQPWPIRCRREVPYSRFLRVGLSSTHFFWVNPNPPPARSLVLRVAFGSGFEVHVPAVTSEALLRKPSTLQTSQPVKVRHSVSSNSQIPANPFHPFHFPRLNSNDTHQVLYLGSNSVPCYPSPCLLRASKCFAPQRSPSDGITKSASRRAE